MPDYGAPSRDRDFSDGARSALRTSEHLHSFTLEHRGIDAGCDKRLKQAVEMSSCAQMAYILAVNSSIISETGGPCGPQNCTVRLTGPTVVVHWHDAHSAGRPLSAAGAHRGRISRRTVCGQTMMATETQATRLAWCVKVNQTWARLAAGSGCWLHRGDPPGQDGAASRLCYSE